MNNVRKANRMLALNSREYIIDCMEVYIYNLSLSILTCDY